MFPPEIRYCVPDYSAKVFSCFGTLYRDSSPLFLICEKKGVIFSTNTQCPVYVYSFDYLVKPSASSFIKLPYLYLSLTLHQILTRYILKILLDKEHQHFTGVNIIE